MDINDLLSVIYNRTYDGGCTIEELEEISGIHKDIIEKNLEIISDNPEMYLKYSPYKEGERWILDVSLDELDKDYYAVSLNPIEKAIVDIVLNDNTKDSLNLVNKRLYSRNKGEKYISIIGSAIQQRKEISAKYNKLNMNICPLKLVYYEFENMFYLLGQYDKKLMVYNLERISDVKITKENFSDELNIDFEEYLSRIWGMEQCEKSIRVKIKFKKEADVEFKVKRDLEFRKHKIIEDYENYFIYEDEVIGINSFKKWLRSFGSSAVVIEPKELKEEIVMAAIKALNYYR